MNGQKLSKQQIELLRIHLPYELDMLEYSYEILTRETKEHNTLSIFGLICFECFFLHSRNLVYFFRRPKDNDESKGEASAKTFTVPGTAYKSEQKSFQNYLDLINQQVTHIQYQRGENAERLLNGNSICEIRQCIHADVITFEGALTKEAKENWDTREQKRITVPTDAFLLSATNAIQSTTLIYSHALDSAGGFFYVNK